MPETYTSTWKHSAYHWSCKRDVRPCAVGSASKRLKPAKAYVAPAVVYAFGGDNQKASKHSLCDSYAQATRQDSSHRRRFLLHRQAALRQQNEAALEQACVWDYIIFFKVKKAYRALGSICRQFGNTAGANPSALSSHKPKLMTRKAAG